MYGFAPKKVNKMEEKDVNSIASAVTAALSKLNADTVAEKAKEDKEKNPPETATDVFTCPDCGASVTGGIAYCQACGCPLEWEA